MGTKYSDLANLGDFASVQQVEWGDGQSVHVNFFNATLKMCPYQFMHFAMMVNDAVVELSNNEDYFTNKVENVEQKASTEDVTEARMLAKKGGLN